jgi:hypothetical protein
MASPKTFYTKDVVNELSFLLVTHTTYFDIRFGRYKFWKSGFNTDLVLDRLGIHALGQAFGPQDGWNLLGSEYTIWRLLSQLSNAYSSHDFDDHHNGYSHSTTALMRSVSGSPEIRFFNGFETWIWF